MSKVRPSQQPRPRYDLSVIRPVDEDQPVKPVSPSVIEIKPDSPPSSSSHLFALREKKKTTTKSFVIWPNLLWVGLAVLVVIVLAIAVVVPIAVLNNTGRTKETI